MSEKRLIDREQFRRAADQFFDEFDEGDANEETVLKCMLIGLAFCKLELMLFLGGGHD